MSTVCWSVRLLPVWGGWLFRFPAFSACLSDLTHRKDNEILIMRRLAGRPGTVPPSVGRTGCWVAMKLASFRGPLKIGDGIKSGGLLIILAEGWRRICKSFYLIMVFKM